MGRRAIPINVSSLQAPLLQTKLQVPRALSGLVDRPQIYTRLDGMLQSRLMLVTAPAGFGKTTSVAQWAKRKEFPLAWLSLDGGDNDPVRFWAYVAAALGGLRPTIGVEMAPMLRSSTSPHWEAAISLLIDDLSQLPFDSALVLDDYHVISEPLVHETLSFLVRYAPEQFHVIIAGRMEPPLSLPRLRAAGQVAELTARDLVFSAEEVASFYQQRNLGRLDRGDRGRAGQGGKKAGWIRNGVFTPITYRMSADAAAALNGQADGCITVGNDLVIWTTHFTTFVAYTETTLNPVLGGTVSLGQNVTVAVPAWVSGGANVSITAEASPPTVPTGFTLLGSAYRFNVNGQENYTFQKPVTLTFTFDPSRVSGSGTPAVY